jgi:hypothetical protein
VAQWYVVYSVIAPFLHGLLAFGLGMIAHVTMNFSMGGGCDPSGDRFLEFRHL